uniref:Uncharacterized protein n=1 Tax=Mycena chlorophos TaxID=658473 RepID=A0ABQ0MCX1_MYCCL|nr:predicted protein [Mycena chlorophos]
MATEPSHPRIPLRRSPGESRELFSPNQAALEVYRPSDAFARKIHEYRDAHKAPIPWAVVAILSVGANGQFSTLHTPTPSRNPSVHTASTSVTAVPTTQSSSPLDLRIAVGAALGGAALLALLIVGIWLLLRKRHARYSRDQSLQWKPHPRDGASELGLPPPTPFVVGLPDSDRRERRVRRDRNQPRRAQYEHDEKRDDGLGGDAEDDDDEMTMVGHAPLATSPPRKSQFMAGALPESWPPSNQELSVPSSMPQPPPLVLAPLRAQRQASTSRTIIR